MRQPIPIRSRRTALRRGVMESLERRQLFAVSLDPAGYTVVTPGSGDRVVYVSSSTGSDSNDGSSTAEAVKSLARGSALLRDNTGDQLLLKRGDTWRGAFPNWEKDGASADRPMVLGAFGTGSRPTVATTGGTAFSATGSPLSHLVLQGIKFTASARDPTSTDFTPGAAANASSGLHFSAPVSNLLIEDCEVSSFGTNVVFWRDVGARSSDVRLRRNVIVDAYAYAGTNAEGLFAHGVDGLLLEGNVFDHNGWNERVPGAGATIFNHNVYLMSGTTGVVAKGNVFANAGSHGLQARSGGDILDNLFVANPMHLSYGLLNGNGSPTPGGVSGIVNGNVFLGTRDISGASRGTGIEIANLRPAAGSKRGTPTFLSNNVFSNVEGNGVAWQAGSGPAISLSVGTGVNDATLAAGLRDLTIQGNVVHAWTKGLTFRGGMVPGGSGTIGYSGLVIKRNAFSKIRSSLVVDHPATFNGAAERWTANTYDAGTSESRLLRVNGRSLTVDDWSGADGVADDKKRSPAFAAPNRSLSAYAAGDAAQFFASIRGMSAATGSATTYSAAGAIDFIRAGFQDTADATPRSWAAPSGPTATADLPTAVVTDESSLTFTVTFRDGEGLDLATINAGAVKLMSRGVELPATLQGVVPADDGRSATATYHVASPKAVWRKADAGVYKVVAIDGVVRDTDGFALESGLVGSTTIGVTVVPAPPRVTKVKFVKGKKAAPDAIWARFDRDLVAVPPAGGLVISRLPDAGDPALLDPAVAANPTLAATPVDLSAATATYDPVKRRVTWTFAPVATPESLEPVSSPAVGQLPTGRYQVRLSSSGFTATEDGKTLDGNADGLGGDDFVWGKLVKAKRQE